MTSINLKKYHHHYYWTKEINRKGHHRSDQHHHHHNHHHQHHHHHFIVITTSSSSSSSSPSSIDLIIIVIESFKLMPSTIVPADDSNHSHGHHFDLPCGECGVENSKTVDPEDWRSLEATVCWWLSHVHCSSQCTWTRAWGPPMINQQDRCHVNENWHCPCIGQLFQDLK